MPVSLIANYILVSWRYMQRTPVITTITLAGLVLGFSCILWSLLYLNHLNSYDKGFSDSDNIYISFARSEIWPRPQVIENAWLEQLRNSPEFSGTMEFTGASNDASQAVYWVNDRMYSGEVSFVSDNFFNVFDFSFVEGDLTNALLQPHSVVITQSLAGRLFPGESALGQAMQFPGDQPLVVTGVIDDSTINTHFTRDIYTLTSAVSLVRGTPEGRKTRVQMWYYLKSQPGVDIATEYQRVQTFLDEKIEPHPRGWQRPVYELLPIDEIRQYTSAMMFGGEERPLVITHRHIAILVMSLGLLVFVVSMVNYTSLVSVQLFRRIKEFTLRRAVGSNGLQLRTQWVVEAALLALVSSGISLVVLCELLNLPRLQVDGKSLLLSLDGLSVSLWVVSYIALVAVIGGWIPAWRTAISLKSGGSNALTSQRSGRLLLFAQFGVAGVLIILGLFGQAQLNHLNTLDRGYNPDGVYVVSVQGIGSNLRAELPLNMVRIKSVYRSMDGVIAVTATLKHPAELSHGFGMGEQFLLVGSGELAVQMGTVSGSDGTYLEVYDIPLIAGRGPSEYEKGDIYGLFKGEASPEQVHIEVTITRSTQKKLGFDSPEAAIGQRLMLPMEHLSNAEEGPQGLYYEIVGVCEDVLFGKSSNMQEVSFFGDMFWNPRVVSVRVDPHAQGNMRKRIEDVWRREMPGVDASVEYLPEVIRRSSEPLQRMTRLFGLASIVAIVIACLGLYATSLFSVQRRTKEVGIRKVLGASVSSVVLELSRALLMPVGVAAIAVVPISYLAVNYLLQGFSIRVDAGPLWFCVGAGLLLLIAGITVSVHTWRSARTNPVVSLRYE